jgi:hypothetical protein
MDEPRWDKLFPEWDGEKYRIRWWDRCLLAFVRTRKAVDGNTTVYFKKWRGRFYIYTVMQEYTTGQ